MNPLGTAALKRCCLLAAGLGPALGVDDSRQTLPRCTRMCEIMAGKRHNTPQHSSPVWKTRHYTKNTKTCPPRLGETYTYLHILPSGQRTNLNLCVCQKLRATCTRMFPETKWGSNPKLFTKLF